MGPRRSLCANAQAACASWIAPRQLAARSRDSALSEPESTELPFARQAAAAESIWKPAAIGNASTGPRFVRQAAVAGTRAELARAHGEELREAGPCEPPLRAAGLREAGPRDVELRDAARPRAAEPCTVEPCEEEPWLPAAGLDVGLGAAAEGLADMDREAEEPLEAAEFCERARDEHSRPCAPGRTRAACKSTLPTAGESRTTCCLPPGEAFPRSMPVVTNRPPGALEPQQSLPLSTPLATPLVTMPLSTRDEQRLLGV